jgi:hypothetical protein
MKNQLMKNYKNYSCKQLWSVIIQLQAEVVGFRARIAALEREVALLKGCLDEGSSEAILDELLPPRKRGRLLQKPTNFFN